MLNMGGPSTVRVRYSFINKYAAIGGGSPILKYSEKQGHGMAKLLDELHPDTAPHKILCCTAREMKADGVTRAVAFTQYPQYSCSTTGSSLNEIFRRGKAGEFGQDISWSVIDRWGTHPGFIEAVAQNIESALAKFPASTRSETVVLFSAHSLPLFRRQYRQSCSALDNRTLIVWCGNQKSVPSRWMGPQTSESLKGLARLGRKQVVLTLYELDLEYMKEARELGIEIHRSESLNESPVFIRALADIAAEHLRGLSSGSGPTSVQLGLRCPGCVNTTCGQQKSWFARGGS
ncbi:hypothetical protein BDP27DRAFT_1391606 [Rhodocollybia butyracea]|uniref:Ferrochelatase n=1 Tax=Rhodocollybia butyracea TaxID=206335 RepID=A0A9P5PZ56_9AGAR|nr:hypothetical protein BDP27DRAFT_1391606 [Rhodocollybia butyracea]